MSTYLVQIHDWTGEQWLNVAQAQHPNAEKAREWLETFYESLYAGPPDGIRLLLVLDAKRL